MRAQVFLHPLGSHRDGDEAEFGHGAIGFLDCRRRVLQRHQADALQPRGLFTHVGDKVVVSAGVGDGVVALDDAVDRETAGGKQHGNIDSLGVHVFQPGRNIIIFHPAQCAAHIGIHAVRGQQRAGSL